MKKQLKNQEWPADWSALSESEALSFELELERELSNEHQLKGVPVKALGRRNGHDEFLFQLQDGSENLAKVHLTWSAETDHRWPWTEIFGSFNQFLQMLPPPRIGNFKSGKISTG
ncbi:MAG: hypothetical protein OQK12_15770 [Motiliproteus sp.]|nr:hypothetical protein [Motiliproteus sp.]MCW9053067.1 hypothetical protein [Motiliproteus sp.]